MRMENNSNYSSFESLAAQRDVSNVKVQAKGRMCFERCENFRQSKKLVLLIIYVALFLDFMLLTVVVYAFGTSYPVLFFARVIQGMGSACSSTAGLGLLAHSYSDDRERGNAMGIAIGGIALGTVLGPLFGGVMYNWAGKAPPFLILAAATIVDGALQLFVLKLKVEPAKEGSSSLLKLLKDPYILIAGGGLFFGNIGVAVSEVSLPLWMISKMRANPATTGSIFLSLTIAYLCGSNFFGPISYKLGRWRSIMIGLVVLGIACITMPFPMTPPELILPLAFLGAAMGLSDISVYAEMANLIDIRHPGSYGNVYAITDTALCMAFFIGPYVGGAITQTVGFPTMMYALGALIIVYSPLVLFLRKPPPREPPGVSSDDERTRLLPSGNVGADVSERKSIGF